MIDDLDKSLEELLKRELPQNLVGQMTISFATPDDQFPPTSVTLPAVDLFLYDVRENRELRSNEWVVARNGDGTASKLRPPVRVDCSYLVTAWGSDGQRQEYEERWTFTDTDHYLWELFEASDDGPRRVMHGIFERELRVNDGS